MSDPRTIVIALGGNAITQPGEEGNIYQQFANTRLSIRSIMAVLEAGHRVLITHGNGPQVGNELIRVEHSGKIVPDLPLGVLVADTEGGMGYMIEQCLYNIMHDRGVTREVACLVTQTVVDKNDPSLENPSKFIGPFYKESEVETLTTERGWILKKDADRGWRRVVPSPAPKRILASGVIRRLLDEGVVVIAGGGGGIPVYRENNGWLEGIDAVVDKDLTSAVLGNEIAAEELLILTGVDQVALFYGTPQQRFLDRLTVSEARAYLDAGHFPPGSMGPKIRAALQFLDGGGRRVVITSIEQAAEAVLGKAGTEILPDSEK